MEWKRNSAGGGASTLKSWKARNWIPAFAGMTSEELDPGFRRDDEPKLDSGFRRNDEPRD